MLRVLHIQRYAFVDIAASFKELFAIIVLPLLYVCSVKSHVQRTLNIKMGMLIMRRMLLKPFLVIIIQMKQLMDLTYSKTTTCARKNVRKSKNVIPMSIITQRLASTNAD